MAKGNKTYNASDRAKFNQLKWEKRGRSVHVENTEWRWELRNQDKVVMTSEDGQRIIANAWDVNPYCGHPEDFVEGRRGGSINGEIKPSYIVDYIKNPKL